MFALAFFAAAGVAAAAAAAGGPSAARFCPAAAPAPMAWILSSMAFLARNLAAAQYVPFSVAAHGLL